MLTTAQLRSAIARLPNPYLPPTDPEQFAVVSAERNHAMAELRQQWYAHLRSTHLRSFADRYDANVAEQIAELIEKSIIVNPTHVDYEQVEAEYQRLANLLWQAHELTNPAD